ncbi:MAG: polyribonucleotide nucleotidyltransferase [Erysipelotrichaceae bacterium]|jgi:polyribonucleotide nucleotidyltransferase|nr:polyribonucleotide nucleotidyltransferase [Erysipelotrichaceae bacterium]MBQ1322299.1 polyribonucleotide nucleotidyltransferase [Erysipelotrichaceae bacterium]MBQ1811217.1 polyribonucleotide nucleotidyltransferase [Erysipelotrichaceae bacterium]MBR4609820.1 polyribonucleotide nucleotidyltransferase [Erysipelotrichaceae bacterium]MEE3423969.1 polyribonucleotide nucleotidyltransferase [Erysipelotrichaceae bacterium]
MKEVFDFDFYGRKLSIETGEIAKQAGGSALVRYGDTVTLSTACASSVAKDTDFFPLTVSFEEKLYSAGKIPGGFLRREGRPSEHATLTARLIDRPIRPLFAEGFRNEVQVVNTVLSTDTDCSPEMSAMLGASLALCISNIPFDGPIAGVKVGYVDGEFVVNPTVEQLSRSEIDLTVAGTKEALNMVEAGAHEVSEDLMLDALMFGHEKVKELCEMEEQIIAKVGKEKMEVVLYEIDPRVKEYVNANGKARLEAAVSIHDKLESYAAQEGITNEMKEHFANDAELSEKEADKLVKQTNEYCTEIIANEVRRLISDEKIRPDGRALDEIRPLDSQVDLLPRVHGSAMFTRGQTQVMSITTLGPLGDNQIIDDLTEVEEKRFMHQYNFPPYCVGEVGRMGSPGRREIGHGALGERALLQVLPSEEEFPYAIRTVAEVMESNGSSSQASICAGSMSLMAAGVPIKAPVAGVAMGLITTGDNYSILTDIQGMEDHYGDMDFKVAGTREGITALQMDIKCKGITREIFKEALAQAHKGRMEILDNMATAIAEPRKEVSKYAPKMVTFTIPTDKIREVIGTGGKVINDIIDKCDQVKIDIDDDGKVVIYHTSKEAIDKAKAMIDDITREAKVGEIYDATVVRLEKFGAFVELFKGTDALLHVSKIRHERVDKPESVLKIGDKIRVKVVEIDEKGRVNVSAKDLLPKPEKAPKKEKSEKKETVKEESAEEPKEEKKKTFGEIRFFGKKN